MSVTWKRAYEVIKLLRKNRNAPVDEFGPRSLADKTASRAVFEYHVLCALQLSSQTKDQKTRDAIHALRNHGLTIENIASTPLPVLEELIRPVGFYRKKAVYMKTTAQQLLDLHGGRVPKDLEALLALPGIGPKMAHLTLSEGFDEITGIGVDTHCHRISNQLGWVKSTTPLQTQVQLEALFPKEEWYRVNLELVGLGQMLQQLKEYRSRLMSNLNEIDREEDYRDAVLVLKRLGFKFTREEEEAALKPNKKSRQHFDE